MANNYHSFYQPSTPASNKLLRKRWDDMKYAHHRDNLRKVKATVDTSAPAVAISNYLKSNSLQVAEERMAVIERDNRILVENIRGIMGSKNGVDSWNDYDPSGRAKISQKKRMSEYMKIAYENLAILNKLQTVTPVCSRALWEEEWRKNKKFIQHQTKFPPNIGWAPPALRDDGAGESVAHTRYIHRPKELQEPHEQHKSRHYKEKDVAHLPPIRRLLHTISDQERRASLQPYDTFSARTHVTVRKEIKPKKLRDGGKKKSDKKLGNRRQVREETSKGEATRGRGHEAEGETGSRTEDEVESGVNVEMSGDVDNRRYRESEKWSLSDLEQYSDVMQGPLQPIAENILEAVIAKNIEEITDAEKEEDKEGTEDEEETDKEEEEENSGDEEEEDKEEKEDEEGDDVYSFIFESSTDDAGDSSVVLSGKGSVGISATSPAQENKKKRRGQTPDGDIPASIPDHTYHPSHAASGTLQGHPPMPSNKTTANVAKLHSKPNTRSRKMAKSQALAHRPHATGHKASVTEPQPRDRIEVAEDKGEDVEDKVEVAENKVHDEDKVEVVENMVELVENMVEVVENMVELAEENVEVIEDIIQEGKGRAVKAKFRILKRSSTSPAQDTVTWEYTKKIDLLIPKDVKQKTVIHSEEEFLDDDIKALMSVKVSPQGKGKKQGDKEGHLPGIQTQGDIDLDKHQMRDRHKTKHYKPERHVGQPQTKAMGMRKKGRGQTKVHWMEAKGNEVTLPNISQRAKI